MTNTAKPRLFDTHCHLDFEPFQPDVRWHWQQACDAGVSRLLIPSVGISNWGAVQELTTIAPQQLYYALGFHPYFLNTDCPEMSCSERMAFLEERLAISDENCVAIGECGLDAIVDVSPALQEAILIAQLSIAQHAGLPIILHSRKTQSRLLQLIKRHKFTRGGVLHAFSGSEQQAQAFIQLGFKIGIGGVITYPRAAKTRRTVARLPLESLVLETDAPDMPLCGLQGQANHPKYLPLVLQTLAQLKTCDVTDIAAHLWLNSHQVFGIDAD
ncbi:TatD family hydrolase [Vibrio rhizosphaerae]|uniref:TatD family hydrolase n=1 Tax=Vibrio rhizosphaerae TaxID=398736 RepID=A0ABU4IWH3_9VIBR|nr:TatD family hydrolase [Vibrio rhizosphaerae]MDW6093700.1 TatD family hydrolase [Vibrio rhizosphaerae]